MKAAMFATSIAVLLLAIAATYILPSMPGAPKERDYAQLRVTAPSVR